jgi:hypothetical protein
MAGAQADLREVAAREKEEQIMTTINRRGTAAALAATVAVCSLGLVVAHNTPSSASPVAASARGVEPPGASTADLTRYGAHSVPPAVQVPAGQMLIGDFLGTGVQVYRCTAGTWVFVEPAANLAGWTTRPPDFATAVHFRGPSWESADDGSLVEAKVIASSPVPGSIPQLLLQSTSNRGDGVFGRVSYLQRLATSGGAAPTGACTDDRIAGVRYRAEYRFFTPAT